MSNVIYTRERRQLSDGVYDCQVARDLYIYQASTTTVTAGSTKSAVFTIDADADFYTTKLTYEADIAGAAVTETTYPIPNVRLQIQDTGSGRNLFANATHLGSIGGNARLPYVLDMNRRFAAKSTVNVTFTSFEASVTYANLRLYFHGYKEWLLKKVRVG